MHEAHGIGRFTGVSTLTVDGKTRDYIELCYRDGDQTVYSDGSDGQSAKIYRRRGGKAKAFKTRLRRVAENRCKNAASVRKLAFDLVKLYGERARRKGFRFSKDTVGSRDWNSAFLIAKLRIS